MQMGERTPDPLAQPCGCFADNFFGRDSSQQRGLYRPPSSTPPRTLLGDKFWLQQVSFWLIAFSKEQRQPHQAVANTEAMIEERERMVRCSRGEPQGHSGEVDRERILVDTI